jgi:hypothetical protein
LAQKSFHRFVLKELGGEVKRARGKAQSIQPTFRTEHLNSMILNNYLIQKEKPINITYNIKDNILHDTFCKLAIRLNKYHKSSVDHLFTFYQSIYFSTRYKMPIASLGGAEGGFQTSLATVLSEQIEAMFS